MLAITKCPFCGKINQVEVSQKGFEAWRKGANIQEAMPELTADQRETLLSGICPKCWNEMFAE